MKFGRSTLFIFALLGAAGPARSQVCPQFIGGAEAQDVQQGRALLGQPAIPQTNIGRVQVFEPMLTGWEETETVAASDPHSGAFFGSSVSLDGDRALIGAMGADNPIAVDAGASYYFEVGPTGWVEIEKFFASDSEQGDRFGTSIALSGAVAVVGSRLDDDLGNNAGAAYVFEQGPTGWSEVQKLHASDALPTWEFGSVLAFDGIQLFVAAPGSVTGGGSFQVGAVYVFESSGGVWTETQKLTALNPGNAFGRALALQGDTCLIGGNGAVYVFQNTTMFGWLQIDEILMGPPSSNNEFALAVSISGDDAVIGDTNRAHVMLRQGTIWSEVQELVAPEGGPLLAPNPVSIVGNEVFAGGWIFERLETGWALCTTPISAPYCGPGAQNSAGLSATTRAYGSTAVAANDVTLVGEWLPPGEFGYFLASETQGFFVPPGSQGFLCLGGTIGRFSQPGQIIQGPGGMLAVDLTLMPVSPPMPVLPGETWHFQCWYRDGASSNLTDAVRVQF